MREAFSSLTNTNTQLNKQVQNTAAQVYDIKHLLVLMEMDNTSTNSEGGGGGGGWQNNNDNTSYNH